MINCRFLAPLSTPLIAVGICLGQSGGSPATPATPPFALTLPGFADGSTIPMKYTCTAKSAVVSPEMKWENVPAGTESFALIFHDLEPRPKKGVMDNTHWVLWNIPGSATGLPEGVPTGSVLPDGTHQLKRPRSGPPESFPSYYGPCAPPGPNHHYVLELYALDTKLDLSEDATRGDVLKALDGHVLAESSWIGYFHQ